MKKTKVRLALAAPVMLFVLGVLGACSSGPEPGVASANGGTSNSTNSSAAKPEPSPLAYAQCMRDNGVQMGDPDPATGQLKLDGIDMQSATYQKAKDACQELLPGGTTRDTGDDPAQFENMKKFAQCMRDNGMPDFPDPKPGSNAGAAEGVDRGSPAFQKASQICKSTLAG